MQLDPISVQNAKDNQCDGADLDCITNTLYMSEQFGVDYLTGGFLRMLSRLVATTTNVTCYESKERMFLKPSEIKSLVRNNESTENLRPIESALAGLFLLSTDLDQIFTPKEKFDSFSTIRSLDKAFKHGKPNQFKPNLSYITKVPENKDEWLTDIQTLLPLSNHSLEMVGFNILQTLLDENKNPDYHKAVWQSFSCIFEDKENMDLNTQWFYKLPRCGDVSFSGELDMAYHAYIGASDILGSLIVRYKELM